jgi:hypothetical protein
MYQNPSRNWLYKFWTLLSWFRDVGGGNMFFIMISKTDHWCWMISKCGYCADQGSSWNALLCSTTHEWIVTGVWMQPLSPWKLHHPSEITSGPLDAPRYLTSRRIPLHSLCGLVVRVPGYRSILILCNHLCLGLPSGLLSSVFSQQHI